MNVLNDTPEERARVYSRIAPLVMDFYHDHVGQAFHAEDLRRYVLEREPAIAPASPDRILRELRLEGRLDYVVIDRRNSLYLFITKGNGSMNAHSSILGGSNASRLLHCPASYAESLKSPLSDIESAYAAEGTALHMAIAECINSKVKPAHLLGASFYGHEIDESYIEVLEKALTQLDTLLSQYGTPSRFKAICIEQTLPYPEITGAFGSVDLVLTDKRTVIILDWKFGAGIQVKMLNQEADGEPSLNPQPVFYAIAAQAAYPRQFKDKQIVLAIIQPRVEPALDYVEIDELDLKDFHDAFVNAYSEALGRNAYRERGEWCRFAPCKATCPLWTGALINLADIDPIQAALKASANGTPLDETEYGNYLSRALDMVELAETWAEEIRKQGHLYLESGGRIPGFKLVPKRATRKWIDEGTVPVELVKLGFSHEAIYEDPKVRSVAQMEKQFKKLGFDVPPDLYQAVSSGTTIAHEDDARPNTTHGVITDEFRAALKQL